MNGRLKVIAHFNFIYKRVNNIDLQDLLEQADLYEYVSQYVDMEFHNGEWWGLSPFNPENTPSFSVKPDENVWKDFSSGLAGNIVDFIKYYHNCSVGEAIRKLAEWLGVDGEYTPPPRIVSFLKKSKKKPIKSTRVQHKILPESELKRYVRRPISSWIKEGISQETCDAFEILYDDFRDAVVIPIRDGDGKLVNVCYRTMDVNYKEFGIPKYVYKYPLGSLDFFYNWHRAKNVIQEKKQVILVEGAKSVMKMHQYGYENTVAALTSHINKEQLDILIRAKCDVVVAFDKDAKPREDKNILGLTRFTKVYLALDRWGLLQEKDSPCDRGAEVWQKIYENKFLLRR